MAEVLAKLAWAIYVNDAPVISIPIAICLFFMMYPIMVKIDFSEVLKAGKAMVLVWGSLAKGNDGHTLVMVAINSLTMLVLYDILGGFWLISTKREAWFRDRFFHFLAPVTITALLATLVIVFSFKGETIVENPLTILWIAIPLTIQTLMIFALGYGISKAMGFSYEVAAPTAMIGASNHFEVAIATATMSYGLSSGAALAIVVGVLIKILLMLGFIKFCLKTRGWFPAKSSDPDQESISSHLPALHGENRL